MNSDPQRASIFDVQDHAAQAFNEKNSAPLEQQINTHTDKADKN